MMIRILSRLEALGSLVSELDRVHPNGFLSTDTFKAEDGMTDFVTVSDGRQRHFTNGAKRALKALIVAWAAEASSVSIKVDVRFLEGLLRQRVADLHADGQFNNDGITNLKLLDQVIEENLNNIKSDFVHSFPVRTLGFEFNEPLYLGPVTVMTREYWISTVNFNNHEASKYSDYIGERDQWESVLLAALFKPSSMVQQGEQPLPNLAVSLYGPLRSCRSLLKVSLSGYEHSLSTQAARYIGKTALDGLSLIMGGNDIFHQQTFIDERMPPVEHYTLTESKGFLLQPGLRLNKQMPIMSGTKAKALLKKECMLPALDAITHILKGLTSPATHPHPQLAMRWAMALDWLAEGEREVSELIALTKIGTSLDVLTEGGKFVGILNMLKHLTGWADDKGFQVGACSRSLRWLVKELYDHGRSKILHGNVFDRLKSFAEIRQVGSDLARIALIECALRLRNYTGEDTPKAFRNIPQM